MCIHAITTNSKDHITIQCKWLYAMCYIFVKYIKYHVHKALRKEEKINKFSTKQ